MSDQRFKVINGSRPGGPPQVDTTPAASVRGSATRRVLDSRQAELTGNNAPVLSPLN